MSFEMLRLWPQRSLANSFALQASSIALISVLVIASISVVILYWTEQISLKSALQLKGQTAAARLEEPIQVLESGLAELSRSAMFTAALLDSGGRAAYARPFLQNYSFPVPAANGLALCDINGAHLAGSRKLSECHGDSPEFRQTIADGKTRQTLMQTATGRRLWTIFHGVTYAYTGTTEGVAVAQLDIDDLLRPLSADLHLDSVALRAAQDRSASDGDTLVIPLAIPGFDEPGGILSKPLELVISDSTEFFSTQLFPLLTGYLLATLALLIGILLMAKRAARVLTDPLIALRDRAQEIAASGDLNLRIPSAGIDEVGQLADSIVTMISAVRSAEATRHDAEERFRLIFEKSDEAILFSWPDGRIEAANPEACRLFGCSEEVICELGRGGVMDITDPRLKPALEQRTRTGSFRGELRCRRPDGSTFPADVVSSEFEDSAGTRRTSNLFRDISARKTVENERRKSAAYIKALSLRLVAAQEDARRRLARELHDRTSPHLAAIGINLEVAELALQQQNWTEVAARMGDNSALISDTAANIREICAELRPPALDYAGLLPALQSYARQYSWRTGIAVQIDCRHDNIRKAADLESMLFRIFQEALTNIAKHAQAKSVVVTLSLDTQPIELTVSDNGKGFAAEPQINEAGLGIINMREMAEFSGGSFSIQSSAEQGTKIDVKI